MEQNIPQINVALPGQRPEEPRLSESGTQISAELGRSCSQDRNTQECIFITNVRATDMASSLRRIPAGFYVTVECDGRITETLNRPVSVCEDVVEWDEEILLPSDRSFVVLLKVYASFELGPRFGHGELLRQVKIVVGDLLDRSDRLQSIKFLARRDDEMLLPCSSLRIITKQRVCDVSASVKRSNLPLSDALAELTDAGHRHLLRFHKFQNDADLNEAITIFGRVHDTCPPDSTNYSTVLFNLANAMLIRCQANDIYVDLDFLISLYQDTLQLRCESHPDHSATALNLSFALLARFRRRGDRDDLKDAENLLFRVADLSPVGSYAHKAARLGLQMAKITLQVQTTQPEISETDTELADEYEMIYRARHLLQGLSNWDPRRPKSLAFLGVLLYNQFNRSGILRDIHKSVTLLEEAVSLTPDDHTDKPTRLNMLGNSLLSRFENLGNPVDIHQSILMFEEAVLLASSNNPNNPTWLSDLGIALSRRFERLDDVKDINKSISVLGRALDLVPDHDPRKPSWLHNLGTSLSVRFERLGQVTDINQSISLKEEAMRLTPPDHPSIPTQLDSLATSLSSRFDHFHDTSDINKAVAIYEDAVHLAPDGHVEKPARMHNLGGSLFRRFKHLGDPLDINKSVQIIQEAMRLIPTGHPDKPRWLTNLGSTLLSRFERFDNPADINESVSVLEEALYLRAPDGHPMKPIQLNSLGGSLLVRFEHLGALVDINKAISVLQEAVDLTPNDHPRKPGWLSNFGSALTSRFERLGDVMDINQAVSVQEEAMYLGPIDSSSRPIHLNRLGISLLHRFQRLGDLQDLEKSISMHEEAVCITQNEHPSKLGRLNNLGNSMSLRFEQLGDLSDINKVVSIHQQVVDLAPDDHPDKPSWLGSLGISLLRRFEHLGNLADINTALSLQEEVVRITPDGHPDKGARIHSLAHSLADRFEHLGDLADINKAISLFDEALHLIPNGYPKEPLWLNSLGNSLSRRFLYLGDVVDANKSVSTLEEALRLIPHNDPDRKLILQSLGSSLWTRFQKFKDPTDGDRSIHMKEEGLHLTPHGHPDRPAWLSNLASSLSIRFECFGDLADINKAITITEEACHLAPDSHPVKPNLSSNLALLLVGRFQRTGNIDDIKRSMSMLEELAQITSDSSPDKTTVLSNLGDAYMSHFNRLHDSSSLSNATLHYSAAASTSVGPTPARFRAARRWISSAHTGSNPQTVLDAYTTTIHLLPQLAWLGLPITERHRVLLDAADIARDAAAVALDAGSPETAVELLEQGRSVVWSQLLQLRTPVDELRVKHPALADQFQQVSNALDHSDTSSFENVLSRTFRNVIATDSGSVEKEVQKHYDLVLRREKILVEIRTLPGFDTFLLPKTIEQLAALARSGPVIYLNASKQRCDALIVMAELGNVIPVPLPEISYSQVKTLESMLRFLLKRNRLIISRDDVSTLISAKEDPNVQHLLDTLLPGDSILGLNNRAAKIKPQRVDEFTPDNLFQDILAYLWNKVACPILEALGFSTPPSSGEKMNHVFWCPTGPFAFLPIHAAGLYSKTEMGTKLSHFIISSYLPTLSALGSSIQNGSTDRPSKIRLTTIPQPRTDGLQWLPLVSEEINHIRTLSSQTPFVTLQDSDGAIKDVMDKMRSSEWVHFACHGVQDPENPLDSGLCLADRCRLKLSDIVRLSRPQGGLAFLSACQTAQGDESLSEESVHLAAGMLLAGYGGVVATMWSIMDPDAPRVTKAVYEFLFRDGKAPDSGEAAEALHRAVQELRESGASLFSWVPFIHVGR